MDLAAHPDARRTDVMLARVRGDVLQRFEAGGLVDAVGRERIHDRVQDAVEAMIPDAGDRPVHS